MKKWVGFAIVVLMLLFAAREYGAYIEITSYKVKEIKLDEQKLFDLVNEYRGKHQLPILEKSELLCEFAGIRIPQIKKDWSHEGALNLFEYYEKRGNLQYMGENLAKDLDSESSAIRGWIDSLKHKENLDYPYTESCIRCEGTYCVQIFAKN